MLKRLLDAFFGTAFIFAIIFTVENIPLKIDFLDPVFDAVQDLEITDQVFSKLRPEQGIDTNIVIVNIERLSRSQIAEQLNQINKHEPAVVGIDAFFRREKDPGQDFPLMMAMAQTKNLVLVNELAEPNSETGCFDTLHFSHENFNQYAYNGFANVYTGEKTAGFRTVRTFLPEKCVADSSELNFTTKIVSLYDSSAYNTLMKRGNEDEVINWRGHFNKFYALDGKDVMNGDIGISLRGKIVLLGYIGDYLGDKNSLIDIFYTPLNERSAGRAYPDMYGIVVHANVISMILNQRYIDQYSFEAEVTLAFLATFFNVFLFIWIAARAKIYYDLVTKSLQLLEAIILLFTTVYFLNYHNVKIDMTYPLIAVLLSGDLTELYAGSVRDLTLKAIGKLKGS